MVYLYKRQKVFAITENFTYFDAHQNPVYTARGSFFQLPKQYQMFDARQPHAPIIEVTRKFWSFMPKYIVRDLTTGLIAFKIKQRFTIGRSHFDIITPDGHHFRIEGSFWAHDFRVFNPMGREIIQVRKKVLAWSDTYEIMIDETQIPIHLAAAITLTIDCAIHSNNGATGRGSGW
jgi:uncharacterized protein YxjI